MTMQSMSRPLAGFADKQPALRGQMGKKSLYFHRPQSRRMSLAVKDDEASNPVAVGLLGADAVVQKSDFLADVGEQDGGGDAIQFSALLGTLNCAFTTDSSPPSAVPKYDK